MSIVYSVFPCYDDAIVLYDSAVLIYILDLDPVRLCITGVDLHP